MSEEKKKGKRGALGIFRLIVLLVVIGCAVYVAVWLYTGYSTKKRDRDVAAAYTKSAAAQGQAVSEQDVPEEDAPPTGETLQGANGDLIVDFDALRQEGEDVVAWIQIPAIDVIDYPVVWRDDFYYLDHDWTGQESRHGAIFLEELNRTDFLDLHTIIYGHNMRDNTMFGLLEEYDSEEFYRENGGIIKIYTEDAAYTYEIFAVEHCANSDEGIYTVGFIKDEVYAEFLQGMQERSLYDTGVDVSVDDRVLTLSTCIYEFEGSRFVAHAKLVAEE